MHPNPHFRKAKKQRNIEFTRWRSFGTLAINADAGPLLSHIPFQLSEDGRFLEAHLVRSNPILKEIEKPVKAVLSVTGPDAYISPDWYGVENQVPTWNYVAVHLRGELKRLEDKALLPILERLSADMEERFNDKAPWKIDKMTPDALSKMLGQITPVAMDINEINGTWKLSQNKPDSAIKGAMVGLKTSEIGSEIKHLTELMGEP